MPEVYLTTYQSPSGKVNSRTQVKGRPRCPSQKEINWLDLPQEIWLEILSRYSLSVVDLIHLEQTCLFFGGCGLTEEAARLTIKRYRNPRFGQMCVRINGSWKKLLHTFDQLTLHYNQLASGSYQNVYSSGNRVFTWGAGRFGQLGNGGQDDCSTLSDITNCIPPEMGRVVQVSASSAHTAVLTDKGMTFMFGDSRYDQLGQGNYDASMVPLLVRGSLSSIHCIQVACGSSHSMILSDMGQVYVTGKGDTGQLGLGRSVKYCHGPTLLPVEAEIKYITAGIAHNVLISDHGAVFTFGSGTGGQLGLGGTKDVYQPSMVVANFQACTSDGKHEVITSAAAGVDHTLFLNKKGNVFSCGRNHDGTLGLGHTKITVVPRLVEKLQNITVDNVVAGVGMSIFITEKGNAYWCGEGVASLEKEIAHTPTELNVPDKLKAASIGDDHIIILTRSGKLFSMGANTRGQTGHNTNGLPVNTFTEITLPI